MHTLLLPDLRPGMEEAVVEGEEHRHAARVKRLSPGDPLRLVNGAGLVASARVIDARRQLVLRVESVERIEPVAPAVEVWTATPKGARLEEMIASLVQVGAAAWTPMETAFGVVDPREAKLARAERVASEALKQSGRAWAMTIGEKSSFEAALRVPEGPGGTGGTGLVIADGAGEPYTASGAARVRLLIGPEGGWRADELERAVESGARRARFGPHTMRIEVAAPVGTAIVLDSEGRRRAATAP